MMNTDQALSTSPAVPPIPAWRDGALLVMPRYARLPHVCFRCGEPAVTSKRARLYWHPPGWYLLILIGILIYAIVAMVIRKTADVEVGLCELHRRKRARATAIGWSTFLGSFGLFVLAAAAESGAIALLGVVAFFGGIIVLATRGMVSPARMDDRFVWLKGVSPAFVQTLPPIYGQYPR
jgi:hypothetical protein